MHAYTQELSLTPVTLNIVDWSALHIGLVVRNLWMASLLVALRLQLSTS